MGTLLGCEICETWKDAKKVSLYNGMFICDECANDPENIEYTFDADDFVIGPDEA